jgi:hypothetical protein
MTALQQIIKEAQAIRRKSPKMEWKKAVAQASAIYSSKNKGKKKVVKKAAKKKAVGKYVKTVRKGKITDVIYKRKKIAGVKKKAIRKTATKRKPTERKVLKTIQKAVSVQKAHMSGIKLGNTPNYKDKEAAREIQLFADNDYMLYQQRKRPILINLGKKYKKGTYDIHKAAKLWRYYIDAAMQKYHKEFGSRGDKWYDLLSVPDRNVLALDYAIETLQEFNLGNFTI